MGVSIRAGRLGLVSEERNGEFLLLPGQAGPPPSVQMIQSPDVPLDGWLTQMCGVCAMDRGQQGCGDWGAYSNRETVQAAERFI